MKWANWATHYTWHLKLGKRHFTTVGGMNQGLYAPNGACVHLSSDVDVRQWQGESSLTNVYLASGIANNKKNQSRPACMSNGVCISTG